jgi:hypothetical protein
MITAIIIVLYYLFIGLLFIGYMISWGWKMIPGVDSGDIEWKELPIPILLWPLAVWWVAEESVAIEYHPGYIDWLEWKAKNPVIANRIKHTFWISLVSCIINFSLMYFLNYNFVPVFIGTMWGLSLCVVLNYYIVDVPLLFRDDTSIHCIPVNWWFDGTARKIKHGAALVFTGFDVDWDYDGEIEDPKSDEKHLISYK